MIIKNKKATGIVVGAFGIIAIISTGFAGWTIGSGTVSPNNAGGSIAADATVTNQLTVSSEGWDGSINTINYGPNSTTIGTWFKGSENNQVLEVSYSMTVLHEAAATLYIKNLSVTEDVENEENTPATGYYAAAQTANLVAALPSVGTNNYVPTTGSNTEGAAKSLRCNVGEFASNKYTYIAGSGISSTVITVTATFSWGSEFGNMNPVYYFKDTTRTPANEAKAAKLDGSKSSGTTFSNLAKAKFVLAFEVSTSA